MMHWIAQECTVPNSCLFCLFGVRRIFSFYGNSCEETNILHSKHYDTRFWTEWWQTCLSFSLRL